MRLNGIAVTAFLKSRLWAVAVIPDGAFVMTVSSCNEAISRNLPNDSSPRAFCDAVPGADSLTVRTTVTYAPLAVWKDSHWTCSVTTPAPLMQERVE